MLEVKSKMREGPDPFGVRDSIETTAGKATIYRLGKLEEKGFEGFPTPLLYKDPA